MAIRILLADDHPIFLGGAQALLDRDLDLKVVGMVTSTAELLSTVQLDMCDVVITDFNMPDAGPGGGLELIACIAALRPKLPVIVLTMISNPGILRSILDAGVAGLVSKLDTTAQLPMAARSVVIGRRYISKAVVEMLRTSHVEAKGGLDKLTAKEFEVIGLIVAGRTVTDVAEKLGRSVKTISSQKNSAMEKLGLRSDVELYAYARQHGL